MVRDSIKNNSAIGLAQDGSQAYTYVMYGQLK